ncbi:MAG: Holliday junction branch migration protein RuvA [Nitrospirae bacterium]|nr:MAG: Holliday junction branch migration protein RuvA [Nitrospirota bacterium]
MIAGLTGRLVVKTPSHIVLDVKGVGYEVHISLSTYFALPPLQESLHIHIATQLRNDTIQLYGFLTAEEKTAFTLLTSIPGIGPKLALSALSTLTITDLVDAIQANDLSSLSAVPGIGRKSAGRIALELKDKITRILPHEPTACSEPPSPQDDLQADALSALVHLGYRTAEVKKAIQRVLAQQPLLDLEQLIRLTLRELAH